MRFEDINFFQRGGSHPPSFGLYTPGGFWVEKSYFVNAWTMIWAACPACVWQDVQTTEALCADANWKDRKHTPRNKFGRCVKYFVVHEMLDLEEANEGKGGPRKYRPIKR